MTTRTLLATLAFAATTACTSAPASVGSAADETAIKELGTTYADLWNKHDAAGVAALVADDYHTIDATGADIQGRAAFQKAAADQFAMSPAGQVLTITTGYITWINANAATAGGTWSAPGGPAGVPDKGAWSSTVVKSGGKWLIANSLTANAPGAPAAPMASDTAKVGK
ncbi:MAG: SgcJ/EcaC family oxidoreductase [Gemmatimonadales bacterium]